MNKNARKLIAALREMDKVPAGEVYHVPKDGDMVWDFGEILFREKDCNSVGCAIGLARLMGITSSLSMTEIARALRITYQQADDVFIGGYNGILYNKPRSKVRPNDVADRLEALFVNKGEQ